VSAIVAAIGYLIYAGVENTAEYYLTVNEVHQRAASLSGQTIRVAGRVQPGNISWDPASLTLRFAIAQPPPGDPNQAQVQTVAVNQVRTAAVTDVAAAPRFDGAGPVFRVIARGQPKPDMFAPGRDVIVEGRLAPDGTIDASQVLTSCPSKYAPKKPQ